MPEFRCHTCGEFHEGPPRAYTVPEPYGWAELCARRGHRGVLLDETAVLRHRRRPVAFMMRANIVVPVDDGGELAFGVWVTLSEERFTEAMDHWADARRVDLPPAFGWLQAMLPGYPPTLNLKTMVHWRPPGERPSLELEPTAHPLAGEQRDGITTVRLEELAALAHHAP